MANRRTTASRKEALSSALRELCQSDRSRPGDPLPSLLEWCERFGLSINVTRQVVDALVKEGLLYTIPRVGTFVGRRPVSLNALYLLLIPDAAVSVESYRHQVRTGFESRIAALGGASMAMTLLQVRRCREAATMPPVAGVFNFSADHALPWDGTVPQVGFADDAMEGDQVSFDDEDGGKLAAEHLLGQGHARIAYLGLHPADGGSGVYRWSSERERGWRAALVAAGCATEGLAFHPDVEPDPADQTKASVSTAGKLLQATDVTAVVAANDLAARGIVHCLREQDVPPERWPAMVSFDDQLSASGYLITALRLPWEEIGRDAADLLWDRAHGRLIGPPVHRRVPMRLIPRLTSYLPWVRSVGKAVLGD